MRSWLSITVLCLTAATLGQSSQAGTSPAVVGQVILDEGSPWRAFATWRTPVVRAGSGFKEDRGRGGYFAAHTAAPPAGWMQPGFSDGSWSRWGLSRKRRREYDYGFAPAWGAPGPTLSLLCLRGKFTVQDPAGVGKLGLWLEYRGGAVVYVNGREVARGHLPEKSKIGPETLAKDYPPEAFVHPKRVRRSKCILAEFGQPRAYKGQLEKRIRGLKDISIDPKLLRKGINVLAVEFHRAPYFGTGLRREGMNHESVWSTCGLVDIELRAGGGIAPNTARPAGIQVWVPNEMHRPSPADYGDPQEKAEPVRITGCLNGSFNGKVMVSAAKSLRGIKARVSELKHKDGKAVIPAAAVKLYYTGRDDRMALRYRVPWGGFWDSLSDKPPAEVKAFPGAGACQAIIIKVKVPADAAPGDYSGKVTVSAGGLAPVEVPVKLRVIGWKLPDPKGFVTHMGLIQSPDTLAMHYKVPAWSEKHWKLMEESFKLMGELGNNYVVVPIIARTNFGNEQGMIRWIKNGDGYKYDFTISDRYLDLAQKYQRVDVVCLYAWEKYAGQFGMARGPDIPGGGLKVTLWDPKTGKFEDLEGPKFSTPEKFRKFWAPVYKEITARMAKRGLTGATMLGINSELARVKKEAIAALKTLMPKAKWVANPHADCRGGSMYGLIPIGYNTQYYMNMCPPPDSGKRFYGWRSTTGYYGRSRGPTAPLSLWRVSEEAALIHNTAGLGRIGADFWPVLGRKSLRPGIKHSMTIGARYPESCWDQLNLDRGTEAMFAPGPSGSVRTERSEQVRQGIQECEARVIIEKALLAKKLPPQLAKKCQEVLDQRTWHIRGLGACGGAGGAALGGQSINVWYEGAGSAGMAEKLYATAAEVAAKTGGK